MKKQTVASKFSKLVFLLAGCASLVSGPGAFAEAPAAGNQTSPAVTPVVPAGNSAPTVTAVPQTQSNTPSSGWSDPGPLSRVLSGQASPVVQVNALVTPPADPAKQADLKNFADKITQIVADAKKTIDDARLKRDQDNQILQNNIAAFQAQLKTTTDFAARIKLVNQIINALVQKSNNNVAFEILKSKTVTQSLTAIGTAQVVLFKKYPGDLPVVLGTAKDQSSGVQHLIALL